MNRTPDSPALWLNFGVSSARTPSAWRFCWSARDAVRLEQDGHVFALTDSTVYVPVGKASVQVSGDTICVKAPRYTERPGIRVSMRGYPFDTAKPVTIVIPRQKLHRSF